MRRCVQMRRRDCSSVILVVLTSVSVRAITQFVKSESSRTVEKEKTEIRWSEDERVKYVSKGQREIDAASTSTTSAVELVDAKETATERTPNPIVVAYFVANLGEKTADTDSGSRSYGLQTFGMDSLSQNKPYTGYRHVPVSEYGYGYGGYGYGYGYSSLGGYGYPVLGKFGRRLRRMKDHFHFWRGFTKRLL